MSQPVRALAPLPFELVSDDSQRVLELVRDSDCSAYDCEFVALLASIVRSFASKRRPGASRPLEPLRRRVGQALRLGLCTRFELTRTKLSL